MDDPVWISVDVTIAIHERLLAEHGGAVGVRDAGLLESALGRPRQRFAYGDPTPTLHELAASYAFGIARNHPLVDGNKRTAFVVSRVFLLRNGYDLTASREDRYLTFYRLAAGEISEQQLAEWFTRNARKLD